VQVKLVDAKTGAALRITDASGRRVTARASAQASHIPAPAVGTSLDRQPAD
jgi:hypothetical protein